MRQFRHLAFRDLALFTLRGYNPNGSDLVTCGLVLTARFEDAKRIEYEVLTEQSIVTQAFHDEIDQVLARARRK